MSQFETEKVSDDMLMALADGELDPSEATALRSRIMHDADLAARAAVFTETADALRAAFVQPEMPDRLLETVERAETGHPKESGVVVAFRRHGLTWPMALAASLAVGLGLGWSLNGMFAPQQLPGLQGVAQAVSTLPTGDTMDIAGQGDARVLGSFETTQGLCRLIALAPRTGPDSRFVACRADAGWTIALSISDGAGDEFAPASATGTEMIDLFLDTVQAGPALTPDAEAAALQ